MSLIIPKSDTKTVAKIHAAIEAAYKEGEAKLKGSGKSVPALSVLKTPLRDGDVERPDDEAYKNAYFVNANATSAPGIVDADLNPILTPVSYTHLSRKRIYTIFKILQQQLFYFEITICDFKPFTGLLFCRYNDLNHGYAFHIQSLL